MDDLIKIFKITSTYISFIPLLVGLVRIRKLNMAFLSLLVMICFETGVAVYSRIQQIDGINNRPSLHLMTFTEMLFGSLFFYFILKKKSLKYIVLLLSFLFLVYSLINSFYIQTIYDYNQIPRTLEGYLFVIFSFFFLYELIKRPELVQLSNSAEFWAVIGFFTYFGTTQFVHLFSDYTMEHYNSFHYIMRDVNRFMIILYYTIFAIALWKKKSETI